jgi:hypothetical protein
LRVPNQGPADAAASLTRRAREIGHTDVYLRRCKPAQEFRHAGNLRAPRGVLADMLRGVDEAGK